MAENNEPRIYEKCHKVVKKKLVLEILVHIILSLMLKLKMIGKEINFCSEK